MERRDFLKLAFGVAAGASFVAVAGTASAAPLMPPAADPLKGPKPAQPDLEAQNLEAKPAIATEQDITDAAAEQVQWGWRRRRYYRRRYYYRPRFYRRRRRYWRRRRYYF